MNPPVAAPGAPWWNGHPPAFAAAAPLSLAASAAARTAAELACWHGGSSVWMLRPMRREWSSATRARSSLRCCCSILSDVCRRSSRLRDCESCGTYRGKGERDVSEEEGVERQKGPKRKVSLSWIKKSARGRTRLVRLSEGSRWDVRGAHLRHDRGVHVGVDGVIGVNLRRRRGRRVVGRAVVRSLPGEARTDRIELVRKGGGFPRSEGGARNGGYPRRCARPVPREWASTGWIQRSMVPATHLFAPRMSSGSPPSFFAAFPMDALDSRSNKELKGIKRKSGVGKCPPGPRCDASRLLRARDKSNARAL